MKVSWVFWWIVNVFWFILFAIGTAIVWIRKVDGSGVAQTFELKMLSFIILILAFILPLFMQLIWLTINLVVSKKRKNA